MAPDMVQDDLLFLLLYSFYESPSPWLWAKFDILLPMSRIWQKSWVPLLKLNYKKHKTLSSLFLFSPFSCPLYPSEHPLWFFCGYSDAAAGEVHRVENWGQDGSSQSERTWCPQPNTLERNEHHQLPCELGSELSLNLSDFGNFLLNLCIITITRLQMRSGPFTSCLKEGKGPLKIHFLHPWHEALPFSKALPESGWSTVSDKSPVSPIIMQ